MAQSKRSKKAGTPPPPAPGRKQPKAGSRTEAAPDVRAQLHLSQGGGKAISGHLRASGKRRQARRDAR